MTKIAFITGITGQDGSYLAEFLLTKKYKIYAIVRRNSVLFNYQRIDHIREKLHLKYGDLTDSAGLSNYIYTIIRENPDISRFDPVSQAIGVRPGELIEVIRSSPTAVNSLYYRICY